MTKKSGLSWWFLWGMTVDNEEERGHSMRAYILDEMIHPEVAALLPKVQLAVVPVGS